MNLMYLDGISGDETLSLQLGQHRLPLKAESQGARRLISLGERVCFVGLRPESFTWPDGGPNQTRLEVRVRAVEALGHAQILYLDSNARFVDTETIGRPEATKLGKTGGHLVARLPPDRKVSAEDRVVLAVDTDRILWFDAEGRALGR